MSKLTWFAVGFVSVFFGIASLAYEVPQDAVIKVYDKSGKEIGSMSRKQFKVVKIEEHPAVIPAPAVVKREVVEVDSRSKKVIFSVIALGGSGYDGLSNEYNNGQYQVKEKREFVGQLNLCASKGKFGLCGAAATNKFYGAGLKYDIN